jgi:D-threonate/D-erythronate kinase
VTQRVVAAFALNPRVILNVGLPQVRDADVAGRLSDHVVRVAEKVLRRVRVENIFAEGGATAAELVRRMGWARLEVVRECAPGVATLAVDGDKHFLLTLKPGTYAWPA